MDWNRIVNAGGDAAFSQCGLHAISVLDFDNIEVIDVALIVQAHRRFDAAFAEKPIVCGGMTAASLVPRIEVAELNVEHRGLQRIQAAVGALDDVFVLLCLAQVAQQA
jgi:hypothetical protein